jgi:HPt (histidine-containing phosphotransfer) domain-containing protein
VEHNVVAGNVACVNETENRGAIATLAASEPNFVQTQARSIGNFTMSHPELTNTTDGASTIDFMSLLGRCLGNFKIVERAIATFRDAGWSDLNQLQAALEQQDFAAVVEVAHRFKGAASNVSAVGLAKLLLQAERAGRDRDLIELTSVVTDLRVAWDGFQRVVDALAPTTNDSARGSFQRESDVLEASHACARC